jgi:hypothetical protein
LSPSISPEVGFLSSRRHRYWADNQQFEPVLLHTPDSSCPNRTPHSLLDGVALFTLPAIKYPVPGLDDKVTVCQKNTLGLFYPFSSQPFAPFYVTYESGDFMTGDSVQLQNVTSLGHCFAYYYSQHLTQYLDTAGFYKYLLDG